MVINPNKEAVWSPSAHLMMKGGVTMSNPEMHPFSEVVGALTADPRVKDLTFTDDEATAFQNRVIEMANYRHVTTAPLDEVMRRVDESIQRNQGAYNDLAEL